MTINAEQTTITDWVPSTDTFGARLALVRQKMGWNQKQASEECDLSINAWARYEDEGGVADLIGTVRKIVSRTGVNEMWLLTGVKGKPSD